MSSMAILFGSQCHSAANTCAELAMDSSAASWSPFQIHRIRVVLSSVIFDL